MCFNIVFEESDFKSKLNLNSLVENLVHDIENACEQFVQEYADKYEISYNCAEKFLCKFYNITIGVSVDDYDKCCIVFMSELKPVEEILNGSNIDLSIECERELLE